MRRVENLIEELQDVDRNMHNDPLEIDNIVVNYFADLFSSSGNLVMHDVIEYGQPRVTD